MLVAVLTLTGLVLIPAIILSFTTATRVAEAVEERQTPFLTPLQNGNGNGNTQNHFIIDKTQFKKAPEFTGITGFINTPNPIKLADLKGKIVVVHFWTYTCINCIHTIPYLNDWYQKYSNRGLVIIGVQTPEFNERKILIM